MRGANRLRLVALPPRHPDCHWSTEHVPLGPHAERCEVGSNGRRLRRARLAGLRAAHIGDHTGRKEGRDLGEQ